MLWKSELGNQSQSNQIVVINLTIVIHIEVIVTFFFLFHSQVIFKSFSNCHCQNWYILYKIWIIFFSIWNDRLITKMFNKVLHFKIKFHWAWEISILNEDIAHACTRPILNLNWKIVKSYSIHSQVIVIFKSIILKSVNQSFFFWRNHTDLFFCSMLHSQNLFYIHILYTQKGVYSIFEYNKNFEREAFRFSMPSHIQIQVIEFVTQSYSSR
jgi:hypothetical protein